jgi:HK97 gp10 family phage protein
VARISVGGLPELGEAMRLMSSDISGKIARAGVLAAAKIVKDAAIANAPESSKQHQLGVRKDQIVQPGNLKRNIIIKRLPASQKQITEEYIVGVRHGSGVAPKDAFYWRFIELGTVKIGPRPFLKPALENNIQPAIDAMKARLAARIAKANNK